AALLPPTEKEDELMGEASDIVKNAVGEVASEQLDAAKSSTRKVAAEAMDAARREGLTPTAAVDAAKQLGAKVEAVAEHTISATKSEVSDFASAADDKSGRHESESRVDKPGNQTSDAARKERADK